MYSRGWLVAGISKNDFSRQRFPSAACCMVLQHLCQVAEPTESIIVKELVVIIGGCFIPWLAVEQVISVVEQVRLQEQCDLEEFSVESFFSRTSQEWKGSQSMDQTIADFTAE